MTSCIRSLRLLSSLIEATPVSPTVAAVLAAVVDEPGKSQVHYLKTYFSDFNRTSMSVYMKRLEDAGLVTRVTPEDNPKSVLYLPTDAAKTVLQNLTEALQEAAEALK